MPKPRRKTAEERPRVAIVVDGSQAFCRDVVRGVTRYANLKREWQLFKDFNELFDVEEGWPTLHGIIFAAVSREKVEEGIARCPNVIHCSGNGDPELCPVVSIQDVAVGEQAAEHLLGCRLKHFGFYGRNATYRISANRLNGFKSVLRAHGMECAECPVEQPTRLQWSAHSHRPALIQWLKEQPRPIGIMGLDDYATHDLAETCLEAGISVPDEVAIVGVNNDDLLCESAWPPLSSVEVDCTRMGYEAAKLLDRMLAGKSPVGKARHIRLPPLGVVKRQSTDVLAIEDRNVVEAVRFIQKHACDPCSVPDVLEHVPIARRWLEK